MDPITREEMYLAAAAGQDVTLPTPYTRKEKLLKQVASEIAKKPDAYEETTVVNEPLNITWDGNTEGLVSVNDMFYKVSDLVLTDEEMKLITMTALDGSTMVVADFFDQLVSAGMATEELVISEAFAFCRKDGASFASFVFPEKGIYLVWNEGENNLTALTTTEPIEHTKTVVHKLEKKWLPDDVGGGGGFFVVTVTMDDSGNAVADHYLEEIKDAHAQGIMPIAKTDYDGTNYYHLVQITDTVALFCATTLGGSAEKADVFITQIHVDKSGVSASMRNIPAVT